MQENIDLIKVGQMPGFECENRVYSSEGLCPSLKIGGDPKKIIEVVAMRGRENGQQLEVRKDGCINTITQVQKDNLILTGESEVASCLRAEQSRAEQHSPCPSSNEGRIYSLPSSWDSRSELSGQQNTQRKGAREWRDMSDSDNGEYP